MWKKVEYSFFFFLKKKPKYKYVLKKDLNLVRIKCKTHLIKYCYIRFLFKTQYIPLHLITPYQSFT